MMKFLCLFFLLIGTTVFSASTAYSAKGSMEEDMDEPAWLTESDTVADMVNHPAFAGFGEHLVPRPGDAQSRLPLREVGRLMPWHSHVRPSIVTAALNRMINDAMTGKAVFYPFYTEGEKQERTGLFYYRGKPGAPFALIFPGGGFSYVGSLHEGFPLADVLSRKGYNAFVLQYRTGSQAAAGYESLPQGYEAPQAEAYRIEGLLMEPEITAVTADGTACTVAAPTEGEVRTVSVTAPVPDAQAGEYWEAAEQAAKIYAAFISSDAGRGEFNALLLPGTEFWQAMQEFYNGWYIDHTGYGYENLQRLSLTSAGENAFTAELSFDYLVYRGAREYRYSSRYRLDFLKTANGWKAVRIATL